MKVLIGIVSKNRASILPKAIESALAQTYLNKEIMVFDDASTDMTRTLETKYPQVKWHFSNEPKGYLYARNTMMSETDAAIFCSLDDDAWFIDEDELAVGVAYLKAHLQVAAIAYDILSPDKPDKKVRGVAYPTNMFIGCGHLIRLSAAKELNYYTPNPGFYGGEEKDLCLRFLDKGYEVMYLPGVHVWHDKTIVARNLPSQHRSGVCNDLVFAYRRCPFPMVLWVVPGKIVNHIRFSWRNKLMKPCWQGIGDFIRLFPKVLPSRKSVSVEAFQRFIYRSRYKA